MFFILKLVLIILLNETYAYITQDTEIILLPTWFPTGAKEISLTLKVFGQLIQLNLRRDDRIVPSTFEVRKFNVTSEKLLQCIRPCYYYHKDRINSATINFCDVHGLEGFVFLKNDVFEIRPLRNNFAPLILSDDVKEQINLSFGKPHLIKRSVKYFANSNVYHLNNFKSERRYVRNTQRRIIVELAIFFDETAYHAFMPFLDNDEEKLRNMILVYVSSIQAAFHHPSLGARVDISLVRLDLMEKRPSNLKYVDLNGDLVFDTFCKYITKLNPPDDNDPHHWDISLYLTGKDIYSLNQEQNYTIQDYSAAGVSLSSIVCLPSTSCAIVEFGAIQEGISSSFASSLTAARQIGHILGINYDSETKWQNKYIMARNKYQRGQALWSEYSRQYMKKMAEGYSDVPQCFFDHTRQEDEFNYSHYHDLPGREWTAKTQCQLFLRDNDANVVTVHDICQVLQCETPKKFKYFFGGPALDGTYCARGRECRGGECVPITEPPYIFKYCGEDNWSEWTEDTCRSECLEKSKGAIIKRRSCKHENRTTTKCEGPYYEVGLCNDSMLCNETIRTQITRFSSRKCFVFSDFAKNHEKHFITQPSETGQQALHDDRRPWIACTIHCLHNKSLLYYPPWELLNFGISPYFPDGTWCHNKDGEDYYCRQHYCLPENYSIY